MTISADDIARADEWVRREQKNFAHRATYDGRNLVVKLRSGEVIHVPIRTMRGFGSASAEQLSRIEITPMGDSLHFPLLDEDVYVPALIQGALVIA